MHIRHLWREEKIHIEFMGERSQQELKIENTTDQRQWERLSKGGDVLLAEYIFTWGDKVEEKKTNANKSRTIRNVRMF